MLPCYDTKRGESGLKKNRILFIHPIPLILGAGLIVRDVRPILLMVHSYILCYIHYISISYILYIWSHIQSGHHIHPYPHPFSTSIFMIHSVQISSGISIAQTIISPLNCTRWTLGITGASYKWTHNPRTCHYYLIVRNGQSPVSYQPLLPFSHLIFYNGGKG